MTDLAAGLKRFAELAAAAMFAAMFGAFMIQIVSRYVFNAPVSWSLEICSITYVWVVFWSANLLLTERQHIIFDVLYKKFPPHTQRIAAIANTAMFGLVFLAATPTILDYIMSLRRSTMILRIPYDYVYACFGVFMIAAVVGAVLRLRRLAGGNWQQHL
ncbi:MAG: TRAP transporter small permease [Rhodospirillaceae bacterium]|jgi:TRAP-type C4-dicarboxylate transport system permease small subunit|nr:TRAP transporter small permease [Rhodospirillaceae bacterium]